MKARQSATLPIVTFASLSLLTGTVSAAGFALIEQSTSSMGSAYAGSAAGTGDATTIYFNPAGMTELEGAEAVFGLHIVQPSTKFSDDGSSGPGGAPLGSNRGGDAGVTGLVPNFYYSRGLTPELKFGLGINAPFGLSTEYDKGWIGRYHAIESHMQSVNINPSLAWQASEQLSVGAGISLQYLSVELTNAIDQAALCSKLASDMGAPFTNCAGIPTTNDGYANVSGTSWGWGANLGLLYRIGNATRIGAAWRSSIKHELEGDAEFDGIHPVLGGAGFFTNTDASAEVELPATLSVSGYHQLNSRWALLGDVTWTQWSSFDELRIEYDAGSQGPTVQREEWEDSMRYAIGIHFRHSDQMLLRAGLALDQTPIPSAELRTPRIPGNDRTWLTVGMNYSISPQLSLDVGYAHLFVKDSGIANDNGAGATLKGGFESQTDILSGQLNWRF
ncbi:MAG TPA: aromatic hydrocarbon degradation protein [Gammaproteobacteria bacterium]|nr:aromatic hydrocarbon degradation protein [Gammaproteobacteria bacterium]